MSRAENGPLDRELKDALRALTQERILGPYRLLERLGRGGMGLVHSAEPRGGGPPVALKTVRVPEPSMLSGIRREIHALSRLRHPGIVRIVDAGVEAGLPWYAMDLVEGRTLRQALRAPLDEAAGPVTPLEHDPEKYSITSLARPHRRSDRQIDRMTHMLFTNATR